MTLPPLNHVQAELSMSAWTWFRRERHLFASTWVEDNRSRHES